jgi:phage terminase small subunit
LSVKKKKVDPIVKLPAKDKGKEREKPVSTVRDAVVGEKRKREDKERVKEEEQPTDSQQDEPRRKKKRRRKAADPVVVDP